MSQQMAYAKDDYYNPVTDLPTRQTRNLIGYITVV